jgi:hypothetical protein
MNVPAPGDDIRVARLLEACEELADKLGLRVVRGALVAMGGLCRIKDEWRLYLRDDCEPEEQLDHYARAFARFDLTSQYVLPALREEIEKHQ